MDPPPTPHPLSLGQTHTHKYAQTEAIVKTDASTASFGAINWIFEVNVKIQTAPV